MFFIRYTEFRYTKMWEIFSPRSVKPVPDNNWWQYVNTANAALLIVTFLSCYLVRRASKWLTQRRAHVAAAQGENVVVELQARKSQYHQALTIGKDRVQREDSIPEETDTEYEDDMEEPSTSVAPVTLTSARRSMH